MSKTYRFGDTKSKTKVRTTGECCGSSKGYCEGGEIETIGMLMGVQLRPKSGDKSKVNDNFIFEGKKVSEHYPKSKSEDAKGGLEKLKPGRAQDDCE